ncbi:MAG: sigma 54-interacting transcriptional regulator [Dissulfuribacterales bacterium]
MKRPARLEGEVFDKATMESMLSNANDTLAIFYMHFCKTMLCYLLGAYPKAIKHADLAEKLAGRVPGNVVIPVCNLYDSLSRLAIYDTLTEDKKGQAMARVNANQAKMKKWMELAPANYAHKFFLVEAEKARVLKQNDNAVKHYDRAICLARENGYVNEEALANELAAKFRLKRDRHEFAGIFMQKAYSCYSLWGTSAKIEYLLEKYHPLLSKAWPDSTIAANKTSLNKPRQIDRDPQGLDLATLMKASQAISSEILRDNLLRTMMKIVIENAGAEKGFLLLSSKDRLRIAALGIAETQDASVILYGESGTGKELVAKEIHEMGDRKNGNFVPVNCGALPENLMESEFFGYKKGAFTGANADKKGFLDMAHGGTLFLDELGEISLNFQVKLLRALEDGSYTPLGSQQSRTSDARVVAAINRDLQAAIRKGQMREDFFYRVHIIPIYLPPLRDRAEDIPLPIEHFLKIHSQHAQAPAISGNMLEALLPHDWSGNFKMSFTDITRWVKSIF